MKNHLILGLTGGFGTGKSTAAGLFEELGACVIDADRLAHGALMKGSEVHGRIARIFPSAETADGFDRKKIAEEIFKDPSKRRQLEEIIHPYVFDRMEDGIVEAEEEVVVLSVPLLFETGFNKRCDRNVVVSAPQEAVKERLKARGFSAKEIEARQNAQWPLEKKIEKADYVINNSSNLDALKREVEKVWKDLRTVSKKGEK